MQTPTVVTRPGAMIVPTTDGLFVRSVLGERSITAPRLADAWSTLAAPLHAGVPVGQLPGTLQEALVGAGAAVVVPREIAESPLRWHRYALSWCSDPTAAIARVAGADWSSESDDIEEGVVRRTAALWGLDVTVTRKDRYASVRAVPRDEDPVEIRVVPGRGPELLIVSAAGDHPAEESADAHHGPVLRATAAGAALLAAVTQILGDDQLPLRHLPLRVDGATQSIVDATGRSTR